MSLQWFFTRRKKVFSYLFLIILSLAFLLGGIQPETEAASYQKAVLIPVEQGIERGLESFLQRAIADAEHMGADLIILDIDTPGGQIDVADRVGQLIRQIPIHVVAYIDNQAFSAGTYIALNADEIVMTPGSSMGAAAPIDLAGNAADVKIISAWTDKMEAAAKLHKRNPEIARAMVQIDLEVPGVKQKGTVLSLDAEEAKKVGYADRLVANTTELYQYLGVAENAVVKLEPTMGERVARFVTSPVVMSALLIIGLVGIVVELIVPGFGVAGTISLCSFALYFFGHYVAGFASWVHIALFLIGIMLLIMEIFVPGMIVGTIGFVSLVSGLVMAAYDTQQGIASLGIAALITVIVAILLVKYYGIKGLWNKFILQDVQRSEQGYVAPKDQSNLLFAEGVALTPLRPAGVIKIDGNRIDAVSAGEFIAAGTSIVVTQVEGTRIVVREVEKTKE